jgi:hypothetical protein
MIEIAHSTLAPDTDPPKGLVPFLVAVFGLTWLILLPAGLAQRGLIAGPAERFIPIVIIGFWSPTLAALLVPPAPHRRRPMNALRAASTGRRPRHCLPVPVPVRADRKNSQLTSDMSMS